MLLVSIKAVMLLLFNSVPSSNLASKPPAKSLFFPVEVNKQLLLLAVDDVGAPYLVLLQTLFA